MTFLPLAVEGQFIEFFGLRLLQMVKSVLKLGVPRGAELWKRVKNIFKICELMVINEKTVLKRQTRKLERKL